MSSGEEEGVTAQQQEAFDAWLSQQPSPVPGISGDREELKSLEHSLCALVHSPIQFCLQLPSCTAVERLWMRGRALCLGLLVWDEPQDEWPGEVVLMLHKPLGWSFEAAKRVDRREVLVDAVQRRRARAVAKLQAMHDRQASWRAKCTGCRATLDAWCARFHWCDIHDMGPYCRHCIDNSLYLLDFDWTSAKDLLNWRVPQPSMG